MKTQILQKLLQLRLDVGCLGEKSRYGWWQTSFFDSWSSAFLDPLFPRTKTVAQYHGVVQAARIVHDRQVGVGNVFHLFRLPHEVETMLHEAVLSGGFTGALDFANNDAVLKRIESGRPAAAVAEGPTRVGAAEDITKPSGVTRMADVYSSAFNGKVVAFPYFSE